jgi:hypothetical protein
VNGAQDTVSGTEAVAPATLVALVGDPDAPIGGDAALVGSSEPNPPVDTYDGKRVLTNKQAHTGWSSFRQFTENDSLEVFVSPNGHRYRRVRTVEEADLVAPMKSKGIRPMFLASIDHWVSGEE